MKCWWPTSVILILLEFVLVKFEKLLPRALAFLNLLIFVSGAGVRAGMTWAAGSIS